MIELWRALTRLPAAMLILLVRIYQGMLSPLIGRHCRFTPTCSEYFILAVQKYGALHGSLKGFSRILRCHPWHEGGPDLP